MSTSPRKISGLQRQVRACYKASLKLIAAKSLPSRPNWYRFIVHQFHQPARDFSAIEYKLRRASSQLELYGSPSVREISCPDEAGKIPLGWVAKGGKRRSDQWWPAMSMAKFLPKSMQDLLGVRLSTCSRSEHWWLISAILSWYIEVIPTASQILFDSPYCSSTAPWSLRRVVLVEILHSSILKWSNRFVV